MKTKNEHKAKESLVDQLREIRDRISADIKDLTYEQLMKYLEKQETLPPTVNWHK